MSEEEEKTSGFQVKRNYTLSQVAIDARRENAKKSTGPKTAAGKSSSSRNAWKHGLNAKRFIFGNVGKKCSKEKCDIYDECEYVQEGITEDGQDCFLQKLLIAETFDRAMDAVANGDHQGFTETALLNMAALIGIYQQAAEQIQREGITIKQAIKDKDGHYMGDVTVENPALNTLLKLAEKLNFTPDDYNMTPKAIAKAEGGKKVVEGLESLASLMGKAKERKIET